MTNKEKSIGGPERPSPRHPARVAIRAARQSDAHAFQATERASGALFRTVPGLEWIADDDVVTLEDLNTLIRGGASWAAVTEGGDVAGFLVAERFEDELHLWQAAVRPEYGGNGIGRRLFETAEAYARAIGCARVTLTTYRGVPWNAPYYERLGYALIPKEALSDRLKRVLEIEVANGQPRDRRCAMGKSV